jgi:hypothetical protein
MKQIILNLLAILETRYSSVTDQREKLRLQFDINNLKKQSKRFGI